jgi:hypothetical protein
MSYKSTTMPPILTVRLTLEEEQILADRAKEAGVKKGTFVRQLIREEQIRTGADLEAWAKRHWGDKRLRIRPRK